jgi:hypothetical protein
MNRWGPAALGLIALAGCGSGDAYLPSRPGLEWSYSVRTGFGAEHVEAVRLRGGQTVAGADGFELSGPLGASRLAWRGSVLWLESLPNAGFEPAAPMLAADGTARNWKGEVRTLFGREPAKARLSHRFEKLTIAGRPFETLRSDLAIDRPLGATTVTTWFAKDVGILRQEQRTRGALDLRLEWVAGPKRASD